ncbi:MAG: DUF3754 domain-containing protein [Alphaproteobacteria bacterium]|nr:DUF3754 domain-containing protein [Alphaproteobacteria bacterium]
MPTRDTFIPCSRAELAQALATKGGVDAQFAEVARVLAAVLHYETMDELERLKALYRPLDPTDVSSAAPDAPGFLRELENILTMASFREYPVSDMVAAAQAGNLQDLKVRTTDAGVSRIRFFARGARPAKLDVRRFWGLHRKKVDSEILDDVLIVIELAKEAEKSTAKALARIRRGVRPGAILLKHFGDVPRTDLVTLHPGANPAMKRRDQLILGVPAVAGGIPLLTQLGPALVVIFTVLAAVFGFEGAHLTDDALKRALAALSGLVALGAFLMRQRLKFDRQKLFYQKQLADTVYFHTIANNAGVIDGLVGAAEEQDCKEAMLAYHTLLAGGPMTKDALDKAVEALLRDAFGMDVDFEIGDAMAKLERLKLVTTQGDTYAAVSTGDALARLDEAWDGYFSYKRSS